jgi:hypothetical protein
MATPIDKELALGAANKARSDERSAAKLAQCVTGWYNLPYSIRDSRSDISQKDHKEVTP